MVSKALLIGSIFIIVLTLIISKYELKKKKPRIKLLWTVFIATKFIGVLNFIYTLYTLSFLIFGIEFAKAYMEAGNFERWGIVHAFSAMVAIMVSNAIKSAAEEFVTKNRWKDEL